MPNPYLLFEFDDEKGVNSPLLFQNPIKIYQTEKIAEVKTIFSAIEKELDNGFHVAGYVSYEAAPAFENRFSVQPSSNIPIVWFGVFNQPNNEKIQKEAGIFSISNWSLDTTFQQYEKAIRAIKNAIEEGDTYQVNYTSRLRAQFKGDDYSFYKQLVRKQQASYSAYLNLGRNRILSASPELFFRVHNQRIITRPMKGTAKRGRFLEEDIKQIDNLKESEKEQAENLMIVDLLRNDVGKIAKPGTVRVPKLFQIETYPTLHQMTSTVEAELEEKLTIFDWFQALFPCGSITGAPKIRTMDYIQKLERSPRDVYCGAIGFITPKREAIFNVPIRTVIVDSEKENATYGVGGGVTWDSSVSGEYDELFTKAKLLTERLPNFQLLESLALEDGRYPLKSYHLKRLKDSSKYFGYSVDQASVENHLKNCAEVYQNGKYKVRLTAYRHGEITIEANENNPIKQPIQCALAGSPINSQDRFLYHKTTNREVYEKFQDQAAPGTFSVLLWNEREEITEFSIGNVVAEINGVYYTPPVECGLLAGTYRQCLLDEGKIQEKVIKKQELATVDRLWFINSVRGWLQCKL
jgi:para-aminobenzoate synthetase / 4-amino-4-deoxychorismate lyase